MIYSKRGPFAIIRQQGGGNFPHPVFVGDGFKKGVYRSSKGILRVEYLPQKQGQLPQKQGEYEEVSLFYNLYVNANHLF